MSSELVGLVGPSLPSIVIILIVEHVAIAKSFGRQSGYEINASQEILAQGSSNALGTFVGGYACTGSFGASAVLAKAGSKTPLASLFSAGVLLLALYALTAVFYYIPFAALAGLIIHAVANLVTPPSALYGYWRLSPFELLIWIIGVVVAMFTNLESSIYTTVVLSLALILIRLAKSEGSFLEQTMVHRLSYASNNTATEADCQEGQSLILSEGHKKWRAIYLPSDSRNIATRLHMKSPYPGIFVYRFNEAYNYLNKAQHMDRLISHVKARTRKTTLDGDLAIRVRPSHMLR